MFVGYFILVLILAPLLLGVAIETQRCEHCRELWAYQELSVAEARTVVAADTPDSSLADQTWEQCKYCGHLRRKDTVGQETDAGERHG